MQNAVYYATPGEWRKSFVASSLDCYDGSNGIAAWLTNITLWYKCTHAKRVILR